MMKMVGNFLQEYDRMMDKINYNSSRFLKQDLALEIAQFVIKNPVEWSRTGFWNLWVNKL